MNIEKYDIHREQLTDEIGLLIGNGEMGGLCRNDGLGMDAVWLSDYWSSECERASVGPFKLSCSEISGTPMTYKQKLSLRNAIINTEAHYPLGVAYKSQCFFSQANRHLMVIRLTNLSNQPQKWNLTLPGTAHFKDKKILQTICHAKSLSATLPFSSLAWTIRSSIPLKAKDKCNMGFILEAGESITITSSLVTSFDSLDFVKSSLDTAISSEAFEKLLEKHIFEWTALWQRIEINLPPGSYAETFYRSLYYTLSITGASRFLPGVCQFADSGWGMVPFTNDTGFIPMLLSSINHHERAISMLKEFYKPEAFRFNASNYLNMFNAIATQEDSDGAFSFAHEINITGTESNFIYGQQRHLDGFGPAIFHRVATLCPDKHECEEMTYQVLKGCASFWMQMLFWDDARDAFMIPRTLDLDEATRNISTMSSVIACRWTLMMFARYARKLESDLEMAEKCESSLQNLYWPENSERFLSFPDDPEGKVESKYNCIRSFSTLSYPYCELTNLYELEKAYRTLDAAHKRNRLEEGVGFNTMTANMYALSEALLRRSAEAFQFTSLSLKRLDPSGVAMGEAQEGSLFYFATGYCTFALSTVQMLLQSYDGIIRPFPAIPNEWKNVSFSKLPAEEGIQVTAEMRNGKVEYVLYEKDGHVLLETKETTPVKIKIINGRIFLLKLKG